MGSACVLHLPGADIATAHAIEAEVLRIEQRYSRYRADSFMAEINAAAASGQSIDLDEETAALYRYAIGCYSKSGGLFDVTTGILRRAWDFSTKRMPTAEEIERLRPFIGLKRIHWDEPRLSFTVAGMELDLGGIGKEYAADSAAAVGQKLGLQHGLIDLGGDLRVIGPRPDGSPWSIRLRDPRSAGQALAEVQLVSGGLATSGDYERFLLWEGRRYSHILNPRTGWPTQGLASVSVLAETTLLAGSISTIAMLKGAEGTAWLAEIGARCLWLDSEGNLGGSIPAG